MITINLMLIAILILATGMFVAAEFALVKVRASRINQLVVEGDKKAVKVQRILANLDGYLSACQLGITITALGLGWLGEPTVEKILHPVFEYFHVSPQVNSLLSFIIAFVSITFLHVVLGELAPKTLAIQKAELISLYTAGPLIGFYRVMYPFIWLLNGAASVLVRLFGLHSMSGHEEVHSEEELRIILSQSYQKGEINQAEYGYVNRIFEFDDLLAREVMVPRTDMICLFRDKSLLENVEIMKEEQYTRFPLAVESKDHIIGIIHTKEFFMKYAEDPNVELISLVRPVLTVSEVTPIKKLLKDMQKQRVHAAILSDEYGGTSGLVTIEDILEEIVGEIRDEFDEEEKAEVEKVDADTFVFDGKVSISQVNDLLNVELGNDEFDTLGGWIYGHHPTVKQGEAWTYEGLVFTVIQRDKHRIRQVQVQKSKQA